MKRFILPCLLLLPLAVRAQSNRPSVDGTWAISMELMDSPMPETCTLNADGSKLHGVCKMPNGEADIMGEIDGNKVEWKHSAEIMGNPIAYGFKGKIADDGTMSGTMSIEAFGLETPFTAKRS